ncbi:MAG: insulinase family protein [Candidatus Pacebacteria bacterium]|nr:insulinase family protein [Candidatus Paceibacterota bacterium]
MNVKKTILKNGLRIIAHPMNDTKTVTITVFVKTGSDYERDNEMGLSHFLEHMCFKGTTKRPTTHDISKEFDILGAKNNAFTSNDMTAYWVKGQSKDVEKLVDLVADIYLNPTFPEAEIEKEKGVVLEEINMYNDQPQYVAYDKFLNLMYGSQPIGRTATGTLQSVRALTRNDLVKYHKLQYVPSRTIISIAGDIDNKKILDLVKKYFQINVGTAGREKSKIKKHVSKNRTVHTYRPTDQTHLIMGFPGVSVFGGNAHVYHMLARILTGGFNSRLFRLLREELGVAYYVQAGSENSLSHGTFMISAGVTTDKTAFVIQKINEVLCDIAKNGVPDEELSLAKNSLIGGIYLGLETSDAYSVYFGESELMKGIIEKPKDYELKIRSVSGTEIKKIAKLLTKKGVARLSTIGPQKNTDEFEKILP